MVRAWFENIGFLTIFVPLCLKTQRIYFIFQHDLSAILKHANKLTTGYLLRNLALVLGVAIVFMVIWTVLDPPRIDSPAFYQGYAVDGRCRHTEGDIVALIIRIVILLYACELAGSVRNAPSNYNESKVIGFTTYTWAIFTGIGSAVATFAIALPEVAFIVDSIAIFVPSLAHTLAMTGHKVWLCYSDREKADTPLGYSTSELQTMQTSVNNGINSPTKSRGEPVFERENSTTITAPQA